ncbi:MAG: YfhO family protein [Oscillospiraceae bacterium]|nr:YfhO family protein [Oscillospiraceae bacterium]
MTKESLKKTASSFLVISQNSFVRPRRLRSLYLAAFFTPFCWLFLVWAFLGVHPFGGRMLLSHDQWHQYYPFFLDLRARLQNGQSLFHSWTTGMGTSYLPLFAYYLASPLNLPAVFLPDPWIMPYYNLTVLIRLSLAGLFCAVFLHKVFGRREFALVCFSNSYAFCAFLMGYYWNAIWLDTVMLLPLVALGTFSLLRERRCILYMSALFLSVYCSYYIGLFICIFVVLLFIGWNFVNWDDLAGFWTRFWRILLCSLVAVGMTAVLTVPTYLGLQSTSAASGEFPEDYALNIVAIPELSKSEGIELMSRGSLADLFSFFGKEIPSFGEDAVSTPNWIGAGDALLDLRYGYIGSFLASLRIPLLGFRDILSNTGTCTAPTAMEGLPNIFCGFLTLILAVAYLLNRRINRRERIFTALLLLFFASSFLFRPLDYLWHGMHFPNMLPHRFSFLWSFTVIFMAFRSYVELEHLSHRRAISLMLPLSILALCVISSGTTLCVISTIMIALLGFALILFYSIRRIRKETLALVFCIFMSLESLACSLLGAREVDFSTYACYPLKREDSSAIIAQMQDRETDTVDLWRAEFDQPQTLNDSTLNRFNGISVFSSAANSHVSTFMQSIGLAGSAPSNRYVYRESDPFTNLLLGLKYLINRNGRYRNPKYFRQLDQKGDVLLLQNRSYLSLGFLVSDKALSYDASQISGLPYERLNRLFREMTDSESELFVPLAFSDVTAVGTAELDNKNSSSFKVLGDCDSDNYVEASFVMPEDGLLCIFSKSSNLEDLKYFLNGEEQYSWSDHYGFNQCMGDFAKGDRLSLRYYAKSGKSGTVTLGGALFQTEVFDAAYDKLAESSMIPTMVSDTKLEGAIRVREPGLLYLSIPNDNGWTMYVDNNPKPTRITPVGNAMIAVHLEPGTHTINLQYEAPGFALGFRISMICLVIFWLMVIASLLLRLFHPPIVKLPVKLADPRTDADRPAHNTPPSAEPIPVRETNNYTSDQKPSFSSRDTHSFDPDANCDLEALFALRPEAEAPAEAEVSDQTQGLEALADLAALMEDELQSDTPTDDEP